MDLHSIMVMYCILGYLKVTKKRYSIPIPPPRTRINMVCFIFSEFYMNQNKPEFLRRV